MAVLNKIRSRGIFLILVIALALFAFILSDVINKGGFSTGKDQNTIGIINGEDISRIDFSNRLQLARQNSQQDLSSVQSAKQVWDMTVQQTLIDQQIEKLGIEPGQAEISNIFSLYFGQDPQLTTNGRFDINKYHGLLEQLKENNPQAYQNQLIMENQLINQVKTNSYISLLEAGINATTADAKIAYQLGNQSFDFKYVKVPYSSVADDKVAVNNSEIQNYINNHKDEFTSKGLRDIQYVLFEEKASDQDIDDTKKELTDLLEDHKTYNKAAGVEETVKGFRTTDDYESFLSENSDTDYNDGFYFKSELPKEYADTIIKLDKGQSFGPYKENGYWKYSKVVDTDQIPDSVKVKQILISYKGTQAGQNLDRTQAEAEELADSLLTVIKADNDKFNDIVEEYSDDPASKEKEGDLGWIEHQKGQTSNPVFDFIFSNKPGSYDVIETPMGYLILNVDDTRNEQKVVKLATLTKKIEASEKTENELFNETTKFQIAAQKGDFSEEAKSNSYQVRTVKNLDPMSEDITGIGAHRNIVKWTFEEDSKPGDIKRFEIDHGYVVVQITGSASEGLQSVEDAKDKVLPILRNKKKVEYLTDQLKGENLNDIAGKFGTQVKTKTDVDFEDPDIEGKEPKVVAAAFGLNDGEISQPIGGENGIYVIQLSQKKPLDKLNSYNGFKYQEAEKNQNAAGQDAIDALKEKAEIVEHLSDSY